MEVYVYGFTQTYKIVILLYIDYSIPRIKLNS